VPIPFGIFGSLVLLLAVEAALTAFFVFVWPSVHARTFVILGCALVLGAFTSIALWLWFLSPLNGIGIAGGSPSDGQTLDLLKAHMQQRYVLVVAAVAAAQTGAIVILRLWLGAARA
jgi:hypothetical protein